MNNENKILNINHEINKKDLIINAIVMIVIAIIGTILLIAGLNDGLYIENETVRKTFIVITDIGSENINIVVFTICYVAVEKKFGKRMILYFATINLFTGFLKWTFQDPRPDVNYTLDYGVSDSYGFPSGHTTNAVSNFGYLYITTQDLEKKKRLPIQIISIILFFLVPYSRLVIGVHDIGDVLGGFLIGISLLSVCMLLEPKIEDFIEEWGMWKKIIVGVILSTVIWLLFSFILSLIHPEEKMDQIKDLALVGGMFLGASVGIPLERKHVDYHPEQLTLPKKLMAAVIGLVLTFGTYFALSFAFGYFPDEIYYLTRYIRYGLVTGTVCVLVPLVLKKILQK